MSVSRAHALRTPSERPRPSPDWDSIVVSTDINDVEAMSGAIKDGIVGEHVQVKAGKFTARWTAVHLSTLVLQFGREDSATATHIRVPDDKWVFVVPLSADGEIRWDGCVVPRGAQIVCAPGAASTVFNPGGAEVAVTSVRLDGPPEILAAARRLTGAASSRIIQPRPADGRAIEQVLEEIRNTAESRSNTLSPVSLDRAEERLMVGLVACLNGCERVDHRVKATESRSRIVRQAEEFLAQHVGEAISIERLSRIAEVSQRSFRNAFYHTYTIGPKKYLRIRQLHSVRRALRSREGRGSVTAAATLHGFYELGRFAAEYRALFGETPSKTLKKARVSLS